MSKLADLLRDQGFQSDIGDGFKSLLQGASNSVASGVSAPVDGLAWLLKQAGVNTGTPVGGSDWMAQQGLTAEPKNKLAGLLATEPHPFVTMQRYHNHSFSGGWFAPVLVILSAWVVTPE